MCLFMCRRREKIMEGITMLDPKKVRLGICPIGWSNDDMWDLGDENTFQQCISEMKLAGFDGCEVGHKYPEDKTVLKHMLDARNMTIASKWFSSFLVDKPYEEVEAEFVKELEYLSYVGATAINVSEQSGSIQGQLDTPVLDDKKRVLTDEEWDRFTTGLNKLGKLSMEKYGIRTMFGIHVMARVPAGEAWVVKGPALNSADAFEVTITGNQAHGAMPWTGTDATLAAAQTVVSLQQIVSRNANLSEGSGVITVGKLQSGETGNVMSGSAYMQGTIRSNNPGVRSTLLKRIPEVVSGTAAASGVKAETRLIEIYPVTVNDPALAERMVPDLTAFGVKASEVKYNPGASEDFSFYAEKVPSVFVFLGVDAPGAKDAPNNHSDRFVINDDALPAGVRVHLAAVLGDASKSVK